MKVLLANVPPWLPLQPYLSIPLLTGILKNEGVSVRQIDLNVNFFDQMLAPEELKYQMGRYKNANIFKEPKKQLLWELKDYFIREIASLKNNVRKYENYQDRELIQNSFEKIELALKIFSLNFHEIELSFGGIKYLFDNYNLEKILHYVYSENNIFSYYFKKYQIESIINFQPDLIGFSITTSEQLIPALSFSYILKQNMPNIKIVLGGSYVSRVYKILNNSKDFIDLVDFILRGYAEDSIISLVSALDQNKELENVNGLSYKQNGRIIINFYEEYRFTKKVPVPDFDDLPFDKYFSPIRKLPIELTKGCYWGKCSFCELRGQIYTSKHVDDIYNELEYLFKKYKVKHFTFVSASPSPKLLYEIAKRIIINKLPITWSSMIRPESYIDSSFAEVLYKGGMRLAMIGFESGSQKVLDKMNKGLNVLKNENVLRSFCDANINVHGYFMFGYDEEKKQDVDKTLEFINAYLSNMHSISISYYTETCRPIDNLQIYKPLNLNAKEKKQMILKRLPSTNNYFVDLN